jgi:quercetin dioxygenase-like cupin family protein
MTSETQTKSQTDRAIPAQAFNAAGVLLEFLASPEEVGDSVCLIRGTMAPGLVVPLHRHAEMEILYVLEGSLEAYQSSGRLRGWSEASAGEVVTIPGNVKHALRNGASVPVSLALVTKSELYAFFRALAKPFDPNQQPAKPKLEAMRGFFELAARYGYWLASPEENAAIGLRIE